MKVTSQGSGRNNLTLLSMNILNTETGELTIYYNIGIIFKNISIILIFFTRSIAKTVELVSQTGLAGIVVYDTIVIAKLTYLPE